jgi:hypothetical protein
MGVSEGALILAGYALAHSAYSICELPEGELLVPLAIIDLDGKQTLHRFEAETQEQAISRAQLELEELRKTAEAYAFAWESTIKTKSGKSGDYLTVRVWDKEIDFELHVFQEFQPFFVENRFKILGNIQIAINGEWLEESHTENIVELVLEGIKMHPEGNRWEAWNN